MQENRKFTNELLGKVTVKRTKADDDDGDYFDNDPRNGLYVKRVPISLIDYHLNTSIQAPHLYNDLIQVLAHAEEDDKVRIWVDTVGGRIDTTMRILAALRDTEAESTVIGCGQATSAGSILFLRANNVVVLPEMTMMIHSASYGAMGKQSEIADSVGFNTKELNKLLEETYFGFLTPLEIEHLKIGKEYHFNAVEIMDRLQKRQKIFEAQKKADEKAAKAKAKPQEVVVAPVVKKKLPIKKK